MAKPNGSLSFRHEESAANGALVLDHGLGECPSALTDSMTIPVAFWKTRSFGAVLFLTCESGPGGELMLGNLHGTYDRRADGWSPRWPQFGAPTWKAAGGPLDLSDQLGGRAISKAFWFTKDDPDDHTPSIIAAGWHSAEVTEIRLVQGGESTSFPAVGHYGSWIVGTERSGPWKVEARDSSGELLDVADPWT